MRVGLILETQEIEGKEINGTERRMKGRKGCQEACWRGEDEVDEERVISET